MENQIPNQNSQIPPPNPQAPPFGINQSPLNIDSIPPTALSNKKSPVRLILGIVLILLIVGGAAAGFVYKDRISNLISKPSPTPVVATPTTKPDPTANWKTFNDTKNGISIRIPPDWDKSECPDKNIQNNPSIIQICSSEKFGDPIEPIIYGITIAKQEDTGKEQFEKYDKSIQKVGGQPIKRDKYTFNEEPINGIPVFRTDVLSQSYGQDAVFFRTKDGKSVALIFRPYVRTQPWLEQERFYKIFNQILSTFKFTDNQTLDTSTWKTYTNNEFGFFLKYPSNWLVYDKNTSECKELLEMRVFINKPASNQLTSCSWADYVPSDLGIFVQPIDPGYQMPKTNEYDTYEPITFAGKSGVKNFTTETSERPRGLNTVIIVDQKGKRYNISFPNTDYKGTHDKIFDQILSTFRFD